MAGALFSRTQDAFRPSEDLVLARLGVPVGTPLEVALEGLAREAFDRALERLHRELRSWSAWREAAIVAIDDGSVTLDEGTVLVGPSLASLASLAREARARRLFVVAASAGAPIESVVRELFDADRVDEAFMLDAAASAFVEDLRARTLDALAREITAGAISCGEKLAGFHAPGYAGWPLDDTRALLALLTAGGARLPGELEVNPSGGLRPAKSTLGVALVAGAPGAPGARCEERFDASNAALSATRAAYPVRTLERWTRERLEWPDARASRSVATFRFDGTTCASLGRPIALLYRVKIERARGLRGERIRITGARVERAAEDTGLASTCAALSDSDRLRSILEETPEFVGRHLDELLAWRDGVPPSGCLCRSSDRDHKWRLVLHTLDHAARTLSRGSMEPVVR